MHDYEKLDKKELYSWLDTAVDWGLVIDQIDSGSHERVG